MTKNLNKLIKKYNFIILKISFYLICFLYLLLHLVIMNYKSTLDLFYCFFLLALFFSFLIFRSLSKIIFNAIKVNIFLIFSIILIFEISIFSGIIQNKNITPPPLNNLLGAKRNQVVEILNVSPYFKFKPNTIVSSVYQRGNDFVYEWKTDQYGYKNNYVKSNYDFVVLGDSFVEGMGVSVNDTWTEIMNSIYYKNIYNAGVQGYAPSQFSGTLNILKDKLKFNGVIIGHLPKIYPREKNYINKPIAATGGIESIRANNLKSNGRLAVPQLLYGISIYLINRDKVINYNSQDFLNFYRLEFQEIKFVIEKNELKNDLNWQKLIQAYEEIITYCVKNNKKILIVFFPYRYEVYFSKEIIDINTTQYYLEYNLLKEKFSQFKEVEFVDTFPVLNKYVHEEKNEHKLPYLIFDGHFSKYGNMVIAEYLSSIINKK